ncbi:MAG: asparagine synthase (glutamine-hydrolyzing) [Cytophagales bacterium]
MCGIAGLHILTNTQKFDHNTLIKMADKIKHRGPDDRGYLVRDENNNLLQCYDENTSIKSTVEHQLQPLNTISNFQTALIHNRLSIIDLSANAHQPMCDTSQEIWVAFNGEIYNFQELKAELLSDMVEFKSESDTEVIIYLYKKYGTKLFEKLNGMWAIVIYDAPKKLWIGSRDLLGVKPLYYVQKKDFFAFSSEIKGLVDIPNISERVLNTNAVWEYLYTGILEYENQNFWTDIQEVPANSHFIYSLENNTISFHSTINYGYNTSSESPRPSQTDVYSKEILNILKKGIKQRLRSDVPIGVSLSGGLDSSAVCALAQEEYYSQNRKNIHAFTVSFPEFVNDETAHAHKVAEKSNCNWHQVYPLQKIPLSKLEKIVYDQDLPFWGVNLYSQVALLEDVSKNGIKVFLEGQGADELFAGYQHQLSAYINSCLSHFKFKLLFKFLIKHKNTGYKLNSILKEWLKVRWANKFSFISQNIFKKHLEYKCFQESDFLTNYNYKLYHINNLNSCLIYDSQKHFLKFLLRGGDRISMSQSIECRIPFADNSDLITYVNAIPELYKVQNSFSKFLLRKATQNYLPESISWRKDKKGFASPDHQWLKHIVPEMDSYLNHKLVSVFFDKKKLQDLFELYKKNPEKLCSLRLWRIINVLIWFKVYNPQLVTDKH